MDKSFLSHTFSQKINYFVILLSESAAWEVLEHTLLKPSLLHSFTVNIKSIKIPIYHLEFHFELIFVNFAANLFVVADFYLDGDRCHCHFKGVCEFSI